MGHMAMISFSPNARVVYLGPFTFTRRYGPMVPSAAGYTKVVA